jgi:hypothetical protein
MQAKITRLAYDSRLYTLSLGNGSCTLTRSGLQDWLKSFGGISDTQIADILDVTPNDSTTLEIKTEAGGTQAKAS